MIDLINKIRRGESEFSTLAEGCQIRSKEPVYIHAAYGACYGCGSTNHLGYCNQRDCPLMSGKDIAVDEQHLLVPKQYVQGHGTAYLTPKEHLKREAFLKVVKGCKHRSNGVVLPDPLGDKYGCSNHAPPFPNFCDWQDCPTLLTDDISPPFAESLETEPTITWRDISHFEVSDEGKVMFQEVYKKHEISIATSDHGHGPGIKVFGAPDNNLQKPEDKPVDLTDCFTNVDGGKEIPLSMGAIREIMDQIDAWEMNNRAQMNLDAPLEKVMLIRCMQSMAERFMQHGAIDPAWINHLAITLEKFLAEN